MDKNVVTHAVVEVKVIVRTATYGPECTMRQIVDQASQEAINKVNRLLKEGGGKVVGSPRVTAVTADQPEDFFDGIFNR